MKLKFALVAALLLLTSACADLGAVQDYAKASASVPGYDEATKEFGGRFTRNDAYRSEATRKDAQAWGPERERAVPALLAVHKNLQTYMLVLGKLAGAQTFNLDKQTEGLQKDALSLQAMTVKPSRNSRTHTPSLTRSPCIGSPIHCR